MGNIEGNASTAVGGWDVTTSGALLAAAALFRHLPPERAHAVATRCQPRSLPRGATLFQEGERADAVYFLAEGRIKVIGGTAGGHEVILRIIGPGEIFGGVGGWGHAAYPASAVALEAAVALRLAAGDFAALLGTHPDLGLALVRELTARLREAEARIIDLQTETAERRLARTLLRLARKASVRSTTGIRIAMPLSRQNLADLSGTTIGTASRTLSAWARRGLVATGRERVIISDTDALASLAHDPTSHSGG